MWTNTQILIHLIGWLLLLLAKKSPRKCSSTLTSSRRVCMSDDTFTHNNNVLYLPLTDCLNHCCDTHAHLNHNKALYTLLVFFFLHFVLLLLKPNDKDAPFSGCLKNVCRALERISTCLRLDSSATTTRCDGENCGSLTLDTRLKKRMFRCGRQLDRSPVIQRPNFFSARNWTEIGIFSIKKKWSISFCE